MKGKLIALEGPDGCGKTTHAKLLADWLRSQEYEVLVTDEPTDGPIGRILKRALHGELRLSLEAEALLFAADRVQHSTQVIEPALDEGKIVITERYLYSSLAYQSARGLSREWIKTINEAAPKPDLAILIDVPAEIALKRIKSSRALDIFEQDLELQRRVRTNYQEVAKSEGLKVVDGSSKIEKTQTEIGNHVDAVLHANLSR
ncbi:MAG: dTMP kinase [Candidatus Hadarchaeota archaeon]|nr:dTMP kinase [Candidatus Hadarchaeota archaeon]